KQEPTPEGPKSNDEWLMFIREELRAPFLGLLQLYLRASNEPRIRTMEMCLSEHKEKHPYAHRFLFCCDWGVRAFWVVVLGYFFVDGLGLDLAIKSLFS